MGVCPRGHEHEQHEDMLDQVAQPLVSPGTEVPAVQPAQEIEIEGGWVVAMARTLDAETEEEYMRGDYS